jgi:hypothetical protein
LQSENILIVRKEEDGRLTVLPKEEQDQLKDKLIIHDRADTDDDLNFSQQNYSRHMSNNLINQTMNTTVDGATGKSNARKSIQNNQR